MAGSRLSSEEPIEPKRERPECLANLLPRRMPNDHRITC